MKVSNGVVIRVVLALVMATVMVIPSGCGVNSDVDNSLVGVWAGNSDDYGYNCYTFYDDGTGSLKWIRKDDPDNYSANYFNWSINNDVITIMNRWGTSSTFRYTIDKGSLYLTEFNQDYTYPEAIYAKTKDTQQNKDLDKNLIGVWEVSGEKQNGNPLILLGNYDKLDARLIFHNDGYADMAGIDFEWNTKLGMLNLRAYGSGGKWASYEYSIENGILEIAYNQLVLVRENDPRAIRFQNQ